MGLRERDIRNDIRARLEATGEFEEAWIPGLEDDRGNPTSQAFIASIEPASSVIYEAGDSVEIGGQVVTATINIRMVVRHEDPIIRDETAERLLNVCRNTLFGQSLAGFTFTQKTRVRRWQWLKPISIERRINMVLETDYLDDGQAVAGTDE